MRRITESVARAEYRVDPPAVAEAIVRRLLEGRSGPASAGANGAAGSSARHA